DDPVMGGAGLLDGDRRGPDVVAAGRGRHAGRREGGEDGRLGRLDGVRGGAYRGHGGGAAGDPGRRLRGGPLGERGPGGGEVVAVDGRRPERGYRVAR